MGYTSCFRCWRAGFKGTANPATPRRAESAQGGLQIGVALDHKFAVHQFARMFQVTFRDQHPTASARASETSFCCPPTTTRPAGLPCPAAQARLCKPAPSVHEGQVFEGTPHSLDKQKKPLSGDLWRCGGTGGRRCLEQIRRTTWQSVAPDCHVAVLLAVTIDQSLRGLKGSGNLNDNR